VAGQPREVDGTTNLDLGRIDLDRVQVQV